MKFSIILALTLSTSFAFACPSISQGSYKCIDDENQEYTLEVALIKNETTNGFELYTDGNEVIDVDNKWHSKEILSENHLNKAYCKDNQLIIDTKYQTSEEPVIGALISSQQKYILNNSNSFKVESRVKLRPLFGVTLGKSTSNCVKEI